MTHLYRHFARDGILLYVGVSLSALQRLVQHRTNAHWYEQIARVEMQRFETREEALIAERAAIEREQPLFNIQFSGQQAEARTATRTSRNEAIRAVPDLARESVKRNKQEIWSAFWQWRNKRRNLA